MTGQAMSAIGRIETKANNRGIFVIPVAQTETDGLRAAPCSVLFAGSQWRWQGEALRIDGSAGPLYLEDEAARARLRQRAARSVARLLGDLGSGGPRSRSGDEPDADAGGFTVTDGRATYRLGFAGGGALLTVTGALPPRNADLAVIAVSGALPDHTRLPGASGGAVCFTPGTMLDTPEGPRAVEEIRPGDRLATRDSGAAEVLWSGARQLSGARLLAMPHLRPVRIRAGAFGAGADLLVSPEHRFLLGGPAARALFNEAEVLVEARDLVDDRKVRMETVPRDVTYIHLLTARHQVVRANGIATETFHPAAADLDFLEPDAREALSLVLGGTGYGGFARRCLTAPEAVIFRHDAA
ncbi:MAG TPA: Hint domain-containing protein [Albidovulum sp.]|uniref:Hint domain-containing protein n=1 Tax=Albidovulum sp. TaxID=1872424 RepID=UPI002C6167E0|nr:Hint domain-containing protein [Albidovulum sp.]